jgi:hypothetical protein
MKHKVLILTLFMCFTVSTVFANGNVQKVDVIGLPDTNMGIQSLSIPEVHIDKVYIAEGNDDPSLKPSPEPDQGSANRLPVTWEIVEMVRNSDPNIFGELDYYLSKSFTVKIEDQARGVEIRNGSLFIPEQNPSERTIQFNTGEKGKYHDFIEPEGLFVILFKDEIKLRFVKNTRQDCFTLANAVIDGKTYRVEGEGELPSLEIGVINSRSNTEIRIVPLASASARPQDADRSSPSYSIEQIHREVNTSNSYRQPSRDVMGEGIVTLNGVKQYIRSRNQRPALTDRVIEELISTYFRESRDENINHDIAIAQMLYATNFLSNQRTTTHNYAGLTSTSRWNGTFRNMSEGVRAHIQHLKGYASTIRPLGQIVDPRYDILVDLGYRGRARTFTDLYRYWSESPNYGYEITRILDDLYRYSR